MSLIRRKNESLSNPFQELREMSERIDRLLRSTWDDEKSEQALKALDWSPATNVSETDRAYLVKVDLPEVKKEDVKVTRADGVLSIEGERKHEKREQTEKMHRVESSYGHFLRSFTLPQDADDAHIEATFKDGALSVVIPKSPTTAAKAKTQEIKVN